jgi:hypothetical protein
MTPFKKEGQHIILQLFYNRIHKLGHSINNFGIFK